MQGSPVGAPPEHAAPPPDTVRLLLAYGVQLLRRSQ